MYAKVSKKGQVTIPKVIREILKIGTTGDVLFVVENNDVILKGVPVADSQNLAGSLKKYQKKYVDLKTAREKIELKVAEEIAHEGVSGDKKRK